MYDTRLTIGSMGRVRREQLEVKAAAESAIGRALASARARPPPEGEASSSETSPEARRVFLGKAVPRGYGGRPRLSLDAAASFATLVDTARARAAMEGRTLVYTVRWG